MFTRLTSSRGFQLAKSLGNALLTAVLVLLAGYTAYDKFGPRPIPASEFPAGTKIEAAKLGAVTDPTFVLVTSSTCHFCTESMPFYNRLVKMAANEGIRVVNIAARGDTPEKNTTYFKEHGITLTGTPVKSDDTPFRALPTPYLLFVNKGKVVLTQKGKFASVRQEEDFMIAAAKLKRGQS